MDRLSCIFVLTLSIFMTGCSYKMNLQNIGEGEFIAEVEPISKKAKDNFIKAIEQQKSKKETPKTKIAKKVTSSHVEVKTESGQSSGIVIKRDNVVYVLTTAHSLIRPSEQLKEDKPKKQDKRKNKKIDRSSRNKRVEKNNTLDRKVNKTFHLDIFDDDLIFSSESNKSQDFEKSYSAGIIDHLNDPNDNGIRRIGSFSVQTKNIKVSKKKFTQSGYVESEVKAHAVVVDPLYDIAILKIVDPDKLDVRSVDFYSEVDRIPIGVEVLHCGNILGKLPETLTQGIVSHNSRGSGFYLQLDLYAFFGSSGGGVFVRDTGQCIGMVRGIYKSNITMAISIESIRIWARTRSLDNLFE